MQQIFYLIVYFILIPFTNSIRCFECSSVATGGDRICSKYVGTSCSYGFFGCVKVATYDGGVDKSLFIVLNRVVGSGMNRTEEPMIFRFRYRFGFGYPKIFQELTTLVLNLKINF
ncbi:unnamed protein product [Meloidogyne enterolobii]|uniref:Uncharacterized protein n=1 Tax=Meloidogyne enterolobii TaxID=390850 RepID=A0ACB0Z2E2_MELEN